MSAAQAGFCRQGGRLKAGSGSQEVEGAKDVVRFCCCGSGVWKERGRECYLDGSTVLRLADFILKWLILNSFYRCRNLFMTIPRTE